MLIKIPPACRPGAAQNERIRIPPACRPSAAQNVLTKIPPARRPEQNELIKTPPACRPGAAQNMLTEIPPACRPETAQSELMAIRQQRAGAIAPRSGADHPPKPAPIERRTVPVRRIVGGGCGWEVRWRRHVRLRGDAGSEVGQDSASAHCAQQYRDQARTTLPNLTSRASDGPRPAYRRGRVRVGGSRAEDIYVHEEMRAARSGQEDPTGVLDGGYTAKGEAPIHSSARPEPVDHRHLGVALIRFSSGHAIPTLPWSADSWPPGSTASSTKAWFSDTPPAIFDPPTRGDKCRPTNFLRLVGQQ